MLSNAEFNNLERRLYREGNPLVDELVSTRDELTYLLTQAKKLMEKYSPAINALSQADDLDFYREWDNFGDDIDNISYAME